MAKLLSPLTVLGLCGHTVTLVLQLVGLSTTYWVSGNILNIQGHAGIFQSCTVAGVCYDLTTDILKDDDYATITSVRALEVVAALSAGGVYLILGVILLQVKNGQIHNKVLCYILGALCVAASGFAIIGCAVYWNNFYLESIVSSSGYDVDIDMDYSFFLCFTAGVLFVPGGAFLFIGTSRQVNQVMQANPTMGHVMNAPPFLQVQYDNTGFRQFQQSGQVAGFHPASQPVMYPTGQPALYPTGQPTTYSGGQPPMYPNVQQGMNPDVQQGMNPDGKQGL